MMVPREMAFAVFMSGYFSISLLAQGHQGFVRYARVRVLKSDVKPFSASNSLQGDLSIRLGDMQFPVLRRLVCANNSPQFAFPYLRKPKLVSAHHLSILQVNFRQLPGAIHTIL